MKKLIGILLLTVSNSVFSYSNPECFKRDKYMHPMCGTVQVANYGNRYHHYHRHHRDWVAPVVIFGGAVIAAEIARQNEILREHDRINNIPSPRVIIVERQSICTEWREVQLFDGTIYRERTCSK